MTTSPDVASAARELGLVLNERLQEVENKVHTAIVAIADLDLEVKRIGRCLELLERRVRALETAKEEARAAEDGR